jgi:hypothetical protein
MAKKLRKTKAQLRGPYLQYAVLCERVVVDQDKIISLFRIVDRFKIQADKDELPPGILTPTVAVAFKSGDAKGKHQVRVIANDPQGKAIAKVEAIINLLGNNHGEMMRATMAIPITTTGLHWIDVYLNSRLITRMPAQIDYAKVQPTPGSATLSATKKPSRKAGRGQKRGTPKP